MGVDLWEEFGISLITKRSKDKRAGESWEQLEPRTQTLPRLSVIFSWVSTFLPVDWSFSDPLPAHGRYYGFFPRGP